MTEHNKGGNCFDYEAVSLRFSTLDHGQARQANSELVASQGKHVEWLASIRELSLH